MSSDGGAVWTQIDSMWYNDGGCVIGHPDSSNVIITGGQESDGNLGVSVSRDAGATWTRVALSSGAADFCYALALAPSQARTVYAAGQASGSGAVYRSTDLGSTWARTPGSPSDTVFGLAVSPDNAGIVIAATPGGLFRTADAGVNWTLASAERGFRSVRFLDGYDVAAGGDNGVVLSSDGGATWYDIGAGPEGTRVSCLDFLEPPENSLIVGTHGASCWLWDPDVGMEETPSAELQTPKGASVVRGVLDLGVYSKQHSAYMAELLDISGRKVLDLRPGPNDVSRLSPGVYFVTVDGARSAVRARKIVIQK